MPTVARNSPTRVVKTPFRGDSDARVPTIVRASRISEKYSAGVNFSPSLEMGTANNMMPTVASVPAKKEPMAEVASAALARPCLAIS